jgi:hypothetical protein
MKNFRIKKKMKYYFILSNIMNFVKYNTIYYCKILFDTRIDKQETVWLSMQRLVLSIDIYSQDFLQICLK